MKVKKLSNRRFEKGRIYKQLGFAQKCLRKAMVKCSTWDVEQSVDISTAYLTKENCRIVTSWKPAAPT